jgi:hypothetical protein
MQRRRGSGLVSLIVSRLELRLMVFDAQQQRITQWIP